MSGVSVASILNDHSESEFPILNLWTFCYNGSYETRTC